MTDTRDNSSQRLEGQFSDVEWRLLTDFMAFADELASSQIYQTPPKSVGAMRWEPVTGWQATSEVPDGHVRELALLLRPFVLEGERTYFSKVFGILNKHFDHPWMRDQLGKANDAMKGRSTRQLFEMSSNDVVLNSERILNTWLNGYVYHRDVEKRSFLEGLHDNGFPLSVTQGMLAVMLLEKGDAVLAVADFIRGLANSPTVRETIAGAQSNDGTT